MMASKMSNIFYANIYGSNFMNGVFYINMMVSGWAYYVSYVWGYSGVLVLHVRAIYIFKYNC